MTPQTLESFQKTRPWVLFLSILGFVLAGFMFLVGILAPMGIMASGKPEAVSAGIGMCIAYIAMAVLTYLLPSVLLCRYAARIRNLLAVPDDATALENAISAQRSFWRYVGILALVMICLFMIFLVIAIVMGATLAGRHHI